MAKRLAHQLAEEAEAEDRKRKAEKMEAEINALKAKYPDLAKKASSATSLEESMSFLGQMYKLEEQEKKQSFDKDLSTILASLASNTPPLSENTLKKIENQVKKRKGPRTFEKGDMTDSQIESSIEKSNERIFDVLTVESKAKYRIIKQQLESQAAAYTYNNHETLDHKIIGALLNIFLSEKI